MGQLGFFDLSRRYEGLDKHNDPLATLAPLIPWEAFRPRLRAAFTEHGPRISRDERKSAAGRKPWDEVIIFKALVIQALYNLSDEQAEYQVRDRLSFMRFLGLGIEDRVPDATTLWLKHGRSYYGYKNHIGIDRRHKLIRRYRVTDAARHDSQELDAVLDASNTSSEVWADSAYRSAEIEAALAERGMRSRIHRRPVRNRPLTPRQQQGNTTRSRVRARVEHVFGHQATAMGGKLVRTIGLARARMKIGMQNLAYNKRRFVHLQLRPATPA